MKRLLGSDTMKKAATKESFKRKNSDKVGNLGSTSLINQLRTVTSSTTFVKKRNNAPVR